MTETTLTRKKVKRKEKIVEIKRKYGFIEESNNDPMVREYLDMSFKAIGSYWKIVGRIHASGLTRDEENLLMPDLLGMFPEDDRPGFRRGVEQYFENINTKVPPEGAKLNIALEDPSKPLSLNNPPVNVADYVSWKHALGHPQVGKDKNTAERYDHIKFYIVDKEEEIKSSQTLLDLENKAAMEYLQIISNPEKVDQALTVLGYDLNQFVPAERPQILKKESMVVSDASTEINEDRLHHFITTVTDKHLKLKYDILRMVSANKLTRVGNRILLTESQTVIGNDLLETVYWFLDKKNSGEVNALYVQMDEVGLKPPRPAVTKKPEYTKPELSKKKTTPPIQKDEGKDLGDITDFEITEGDES